MDHHQTSTDLQSDNPGLVCMHCAKARFPDPKEQCYKFGGLICTEDDSNVEKYQKCKFPPGVGMLR
ncbi:hypothetical protein CEE37_09305 [candidate division LCP-89 bacterium B3_LCP]|uniref:Uncharacterized protein n=1 Tax=candidate division LCP-89 bacterium B3_LCP TaxID=2012998 RepID=A0A532UY84_UNCL8|nr:MAG: hypothetical protein CEE37_09305 [candidate division LCP-89 bacterium B3_LCP]